MPVSRGDDQFSSTSNKVYLSQRESFWRCPRPLGTFSRRETNLTRDISIQVHSILKENQYKKRTTSALSKKWNC